MKRSSDRPQDVEHFLFRALLVANANTPLNIEQYAPADARTLPIPPLAPTMLIAMPPNRGV